MWSLWIVVVGSVLKFSNPLDMAINFRGADNNFLDYEYKDDIFSNFLIFPGTKWCGAGNISTHPDDLGVHRETDMCCRAHDMCDDIIASGQTRHGLYNDAPYTKLNCECDEEFLDCLKSSTQDVKPSQAVGTLYFDLIGQQCYKWEHKITGCDEYNPVNLMRCKTYSFDPQSAKRWQWFDVPSFQ